MSDTTVAAPVAALTGTPVPAVSAAAPAAVSAPAPSSALSGSSPASAPSALGGGAPKEGSTAPTPAAAPAAPFEIKLPEGVKIDKSMLDGFTTVAKEAGLDSEKATKVAAWYAKQVESINTQSLATAAKQLEAHLIETEKALRADPEIGGAKFDANIAVARKGVLFAGGTELAARLDQFGLGNDPVLAKAFLRIGRALGEDSTVITKPPVAAPPANPNQAWVEKMYNKKTTAG